MQCSDFQFNFASVCLVAMSALPLFRNRIVAGARMLPKPRRIARAKPPTLLKKQRVWVSPYSFRLSAPKVRLKSAFVIDLFPIQRCAVADNYTKNLQSLNLNPARTATSTPKHSERRSSPTTAKDKALLFDKEVKQDFEQFCERMWPLFIQGDKLTLSQFWNSSSSHTQFGQVRHIGFLSPLGLFGMFV